MIITVEDKSYRCKNCDSFSQCEYYNHRKPDSHICKEFRNDWRQCDVLDKIIAEIKETLSWEMYDEYGNETALYKELMDIIEKYKKEVVK